MRRLAQRGHGFGERLRCALEDARALGYGDCVVVPADVPGLGRRELRAAFQALTRHGAVLGPSPDGGVYLIGLRNGRALDTAGIPWQTDGVLAALLARFPGAARLSPLADLDQRRDVAPLLRDAALDPLLRRHLRELNHAPAEPVERLVPRPARAPWRAQLPARSPPRAPEGHSLH